MIKNRRRKSLAATLFGVIAMSILVACGGSLTSESAKSLDPKPVIASESSLPLLEALTKAIESPEDEQNGGPISAIASLIQAAESLYDSPEIAQMAETLTKSLEPVLEELVKNATSGAEELADRVAKAIEAEEPLMETLMQAAEALIGDLTETAATVMSDDTSYKAINAEDLLSDVKDLLGDSTVLSLLSETLADSGSEASTPEEPVPVLITKFDQFDFTLTMDQGSAVQTSQGSANARGAINFPMGEVNSILTWIPQEGSSPLALVSGTYDILKSSQANVSFASINDGEITVNGQQGVYLGFKSSDDAGVSLGGGLIGAWTCADAGTAYTLTMTGIDAGTLQIRFDRLLENFTCAA